MASSPSSTSPFTITEHVTEGQHVREYPRATKPDSEALKIAVKRYTPKSNPSPQPGDLTIIGAHASGFPKPIWEEIYSNLKRYGVRIRSIWIADTASQGASGVLNEEKLGNDPSWFDHARDLLSMINQFKADMPGPIIGIGHSLGTVQLAFLSLMHPRLLTSLVMIEPVIDEDIHTGRAPAFVKLAFSQQSTWPSRDKAESYFRKQNRKWDSRVLDRWFEYGLRYGTNTPRLGQKSSSSELGTVTLTTPRHQEVNIYLRPNFDAREPASGDMSHPDVIGPPHATYPFYRSEPVMVWKMLEQIRPSVLYLFGERSPLSAPELQKKKLERTGRGIGGSGGQSRGRVKGVTVPGAGHQLPFEEASRVAGEASEWARDEVERWQREEERIRSGWSEVVEANGLKDWDVQLEESLKMGRRKKGSKL
ncbi:Alpha/beta hydrolase family-domain-containing protein [Aspergillus aurantiobrunneus]